VSLQVYASGNWHVHLNSIHQSSYQSSGCWGLHSASGVLYVVQVRVGRSVAGAHLWLSTAAAWHHTTELREVIRTGGPPYYVTNDSGIHSAPFGLVWINNCRRR
jgi:hypothetical protein